MISITDNDCFSSYTTSTVLRTTVVLYSYRSTVALVVPTIVAPLQLIEPYPVANLKLSGCQLNQSRANLPRLNFAATFEMERHRAMLGHFFHIHHFPAQVAHTRTLTAEQQLMAQQVAVHFSIPAV